MENKLCFLVVGRFDPSHARDNKISRTGRKVTLDSEGMKSCTCEFVSFLRFRSVLTKTIVAQIFVFLLLLNWRGCSRALQDGKMH